MSREDKEELMADKNSLVLRKKEGCKWDEVSLG